MLTRRHVSLLRLIIAICWLQTCDSAALSEANQPVESLLSDCSGYSGYDASCWVFWPSVSTNDLGTSDPSDLSDSATRSNATLAAQDLPYMFKRSDGRAPTKTMMPREESTSLDLRPTPQPTGEPSEATTVHITSTSDFALLLPGRAQELISDAESDGVSFCTAGTSEASCADRPRLPTGFITAAALTESDDGSWIQITGCLDTSKFHLDSSDAGGQFDVRFPNGAQCAFGGYAASFIELVEPAKNRFCLRCCASPNDQTHCNSHQDRLGCDTAIPGQYDFPEVGVSCS